MLSAIDSSNSRDAAADAAHELRILLIEDSERLRVRLVDLLTTPTVMRVTATAETQSDAQRLLDSQDFDVLIVDVELPQGNGIGIVKHARRQPLKVGSAPLVIVLTNYALPTVRERCIAAGADYFLDKMCDFDQLYRLILIHRH